MSRPESAHAPRKYSKVVQASWYFFDIRGTYFLLIENRSQLIFVYSIPDESRALGWDLTAFSFRIRFTMDTMVQDSKPLPAGPALAQCGVLKESMKRGRLLRERFRVQGL